MIRYAISDRRLFPGDEAARQQCLIQQAAGLALQGVDYFQLREKDLPPDELYALLCLLRDAVERTRARIQVVLNGPPEIAKRAGVPWHGTAAADEVAALSCSVHTLQEVERQRGRARLLLFAPVFGKTVAGESVQPAAGLPRLQQAVQQARGTAVLALGGVTTQNAPLCMAAGAAGIAGIRLFLPDSCWPPRV